MSRRSGTTLWVVESGRRDPASGRGPDVLVKELCLPFHRLRPDVYPKQNESNGS